MAALFWVIGPQPYVPRLLVLLVGSATVAAVYLLGRSLGGRLAGLVADRPAGHVGDPRPGQQSRRLVQLDHPVLHHVSLRHAAPAVTRGSGPRLAAAGLVFALALQTHPSVVAFLPGCGGATVASSTAAARALGAAGLRC